MRKYTESGRCGRETLLEYVRLNVVDEIFIHGDTREGSEALANELIELGLDSSFQSCERITVDAK